LGSSQAYRLNVLWLAFNHWLLDVLAGQKEELLDVCILVASCPVLSFFGRSEGAFSQRCCNTHLLKLFRALIGVLIEFVIMVVVLKDD
jgi:hypothetical protein